MFLESPLTNSFRSQLRLEEYKEEESTRLQVKCVLSVTLSPKHSSLKICDKAKEKKMFVRSRKIIFKSNTVRSFFTTKGSKSGKSFFRLYSRTTKFGVNKKWMLPITVAGGILAANYIISNKESKSEELKVSYGQHNVTYSQGPQNAQQNAPQNIIKQVLTQEIKFLSQNNFFDNSQKKKQTIKRYQYAGLGSRLGAFMIDYLLCYGIPSAIVGFVGGLFKWGDGEYSSFVCICLRLIMICTNQISDDGSGAAGSRSGGLRYLCSQGLFPGRRTVDREEAVWTEELGRRVGYTRHLLPTCQEEGLLLASCPLHQPRLPHFHQPLEPLFRCRLLGTQPPLPR